MSDTTAPVELADQITIPLPTPVEWSGRQYNELTLIEPRAGHVLFAEQQLKASTSPWNLRNRQIHLISKCADLPIPVVEKLPMRVFNEAWNYIVPFFEASLSTCET